MSAMVQIFSWGGSMEHFIFRQMNLAVITVFKSWDRLRYDLSPNFVSKCTKNLVIMIFSNYLIHDFSKMLIIILVCNTAQEHSIVRFKIPPVQLSVTVVNATVNYLIPKAKFIPATVIVLNVYGMGVSYLLVQIMWKKMHGKKWNQIAQKMMYNPPITWQGSSVI